MNYPQVVQIETTAACNAHCGFCPHSSMKRAGRMSDELVAKLLDEIGAWAVKPVAVCPFLTNEPFADTRIFDISSRIREVAPDTMLTFFTNASLLNAARREAILAIPGPTNFFCSLHHYTPEAYKAELGLDFHRTVDNIKALCAEAPRPVHVLRVMDGTAADQRFLNWVRDNIPHAIPMLAHRWNWKGDIAAVSADLHGDIICPRATSITVLYDGRVSLCCMDQNADYQLGDVNRQTLLEVYNNERHTHFFITPKSHKAPCKTCNMH